MVHGGVGTNGKPQNVIGSDPRGLAQVGNDGVQCLLDDSILKLFAAAGTGLLDDAVDHIRTVANLTVTGRSLCKKLSGLQIRQHHGHGGGTNVNRTAHQGGILRGTNMHTPEGIAVVNTFDADMEIVCPEGGGQTLHHMVGHLDVLHLNDGLHAPDQPLHIGHGVLRGGLAHDHIQSQKIVIEADAAFFQSVLAVLEDGDLLGAGQVGSLHPGLIGRGNVRHQHGAVGENLTVAAQPPTLCELFL